MEQQIFFLINHHWTNPALDWLMAAASNLDVWIGVIAISVILTAIFGGFRARTFLIALILGVAIGDGLISDAIKKAVQRPRPYQILANVRHVGLQSIRPDNLGKLKLPFGAKVVKLEAKLLEPLALFKKPTIQYSRPETGVVTGGSFPSSHTTNNFCVAIIFLAFYRRWGWLYCIPAVIVSYSRIYTGNHWPSDVLVSTFLGIGVGLLLVCLYELLWRKLIGPHFLPKLFAKYPTLFESSPEPAKP